MLIKLPGMNVMLRNGLKTLKIFKPATFTLVYGRSEKIADKTTTKSNIFQPILKYVPLP